MPLTVAAETFSHYGPVAVLLAMAIVFGVGTLILTRLIGPHKQTAAKGTTYESGMNPLSSARRRFNVRFYIVAVTFLVFDVEIVFLYPWATVLPNLARGSGLTTLFLGRMLFFILTSVVAFVYAWRKGVFRYD